MRELFYAGGSAIISDQTCKAVLRYARALARANTADIVVFPALTDKHRKGYAHFLIGPSSQLMSSPTDDVGLDLDDPAVVEILESRTLKLDPTRPDWDKDIVDVQDFTHFDWDF